MICISSWFIIGFIGGVLCSGVDLFVNRQPTFNIKMPILLSFFGPFLVVWFFYLSGFVERTPLPSGRG